jgi:hypothetical protein
MSSSLKVIIICILTFFLIVINLKNFNYYYDDITFKTKQVFLSLFYYLLNNNLLEKPIEKNNKIAIVTFENRNEKFVDLHNKNVNEYCKKWNYDYLFYNNCIHNVYWCKMYFVLEALKSNKYDYVLWLDSDTIIKKMDISIDSIVNKYSSDIFVNYDNGDSLFCSGVFIIKNSEIGIKYIEDCIKFNQAKCYNKKGKLKGLWAGLCYEQGAMNKLIIHKYYKYTTCLSNSLILNKKINSSMAICDSDVFILHLYESPNDLRTKCFQKFS